MVNALIFERNSGHPLLKLIVCIRYQTEVAETKVYTTQISKEYENSHFNSHNLLFVPEKTGVVFHLGTSGLKVA